MTTTTKQQYKQPIPWPGKPIYQLSHEGIKIALMESGDVFGWTSGYGDPERVGQFVFQDTGNPWIPKHKNFNSLAKQMYRDGDLDELVRFRAMRQAHKRNLNLAAEDMYRALKTIVRDFDETHFPVGADLADAINVFGRQALKKVEGGK